jgi:hypothetical protein
MAKPNSPYIPGCVRPITHRWHKKEFLLGESDVLYKANFAGENSGLGPKKTFLKTYLLKSDELVKSQNSIKFVIPVNPGSSPGQAPESGYFNKFWTPAFAGVTLEETFYEIIKFQQFCLFRP